MENCGTNEVLAEQIAIIHEVAVKLETKDLSQLNANLGEIKRAANTLKELVTCGVSSRVNRMYTVQPCGMKHILLFGVNGHGFGTV